MNKLPIAIAAALVALSGAAFAQDDDAARQARMDQAYRDHQNGTVSGDLHEAGHSFHNGVRDTGHAIHNGVRETGHGIHRGVRATGHAIHHGVDKVTGKDQ